MALDKCCVCEKDSPLAIDVRGKKVCVECSNKIFLKYQVFVEKPRAIDLSSLDKVQGLSEEKKELQSLSTQFREALHSYDRLDDLSRTAKLPTELMEKLYTLGQRIRITNILLADMRSSIQNGDAGHLKSMKDKIGGEIAYCSRELQQCENEMQKFVRA